MLNVCGTSNQQKKGYLSENKIVELEIGAVDSYLNLMLFCCLDKLLNCEYQSKFNYKYIICQKKLNLIYSNVIICFILTPFLTLPFQPFLLFPLKLQNFTTPKKSLMSVCADLASLSHMKV